METNLKAHVLKHSIRSIIYAMQVFCIILATICTILSVRFLEFLIK